MIRFYSYILFLLITCNIVAEDFTNPTARVKDSVEKVITIYCETYKLDNIKKFLKDINITDESGQTYRFVIRYNNQEDDLYIYDPKIVNQLIYANRKE